MRCTHDTKQRSGGIGPAYTPKLNFSLYSLVRLTPPPPDSRERTLTVPHRVDDRQTDRQIYEFSDSKVSNLKMSPPKNDDAVAAEELVDYEEEPEVAEADKGKVRTAAVISEAEFEFLKASIARRFPRSRVSRVVCSRRMVSLGA